MFEGVIESEDGFYIGDPCYVLNDKVYDVEWGINNKFRDGEIQTSMGTFIVHETMYGDGEYRVIGTRGGYVSVDSGTIAVIPMSMVEDKNGLDNGVVVEAARLRVIVDEDCDFDIRWDRGEFVHINTSGNGYDVFDSDEDRYEEYEDDEDYEAGESDEE